MIRLSKATVCVNLTILRLRERPPALHPHPHPVSARAMRVPRAGAGRRDSTGLPTQRGTQRRSSSRAVHFTEKKRKPVPCLPSGSAGGGRHRLTAVPGHPSSRSTSNAAAMGSRVAGTAGTDPGGHHDDLHSSRGPGHHSRPRPQHIPTLLCPPGGGGRRSRPGKGMPRENKQTATQTRSREDPGTQFCRNMCSSCLGEALHSTRCTPGLSPFLC